MLRTQRRGCLWAMKAGRAPQGHLWGWGNGDGFIGKCPSQSKWNPLSKGLYKVISVLDSDEIRRFPPSVQTLLYTRSSEWAVGLWLSWRSPWELRVGKTQVCRGGSEEMLLSVWVWTGNRRRIKQTDCNCRRALSCLICTWKEQPGVLMNWDRGYTLGLPERCLGFALSGFPCGRVLEVAQRMTLMGPWGFRVQSPSSYQPWNGGSLCRAPDSRVPISVPCVCFGGRPYTGRSERPCSSPSLCHGGHWGPPALAKPALLISVRRFLLSLSFNSSSSSVTHTMRSGWSHP